MKQEPFGELRTMAQAEERIEAVSADKTGIDYIASGAKGILGAIPFVGTLASEIVNNVIPNQRVDRIARLLECLSAKVACMEEERITDASKKPGFVDLLEDGFFQAARALSQERIEYIASIIKGGLTCEDNEYVKAKKFMWLLGEINDVEVIILRSYLVHPQTDTEFWEKHSDVLDPPRATLGSSEEEVNESAIWQSYRDHLKGIGLLKPRFRHVRKDELPELDEKTGMMKANGEEITYLGRLLVQYIGLAETPWQAKRT